MAKMGLDKYFNKPHTSFFAGNSHQSLQDFLNIISDINSFPYDEWETIRLKQPISSSDARQAWSNLQELESYYINRGDQIIRFRICAKNERTHRPRPGVVNPWVYNLDVADVTK